MRVLIALAAAASVRGFQFGVVRTPNVQRSPTHVALRTPADVSLMQREPSMMDEGIFKFNKFVVDTVYDLICVLYNKNDLKTHSISQVAARFYVLETVARVPYFAYLSVM